MARNQPNITAQQLYDSTADLAVIYRREGRHDKAAALEATRSDLARQFGLKPSATSNVVPFPLSRQFRPGRDLRCGARLMVETLTMLSSQDWRARKVIADHLGLDVEKVTDEASLIDDLGADSLDFVEIAIALEEEFDVELADDDAWFNVKIVAEALALIGASLGKRVS